MNKLVIFNVWWALSSYFEIGSAKSIIDLGKSWEFSPVNDFLLPLFREKKYEKDWNGRYLIDQLFLSHLDSDHIQDYIDFKKYFYPKYLTCPNKHDNQDPIMNVNKDLLWADNEIRNEILNDMTEKGKRNPPLEVSNVLKNNVNMYFIPPKICEDDINLNQHYANNISLSLIISFKNSIIYFPWDIQKEWIEYLIQKKHDFKTFIKSFWIKILIAPHHWLSTSFPQDLFTNLRYGKVDLNIISEKVRSDKSQENRSDVDNRYYSSDYSTSNNTLKQYGVKTSWWHILIDLDSWNIIQENDINIILKSFCE